MFREINELIEARETAGSLDQALDLLGDLKLEHPRIDRVRGKIAHVYFYKGLFARLGEKEPYFEAGMESALEAIQLNPRAFYAHYWYGTNLGYLGIERGSISILSYIDTIRESLEIVLGSNERFFFGGPHRVLGILFHRAPGFPMSIGDLTRARFHLERCVELAPDFFPNRLHLAEYYCDISAIEEAREQLHWLADTPLNPGHAQEDMICKMRAAALMENMPDQA